MNLSNSVFDTKRGHRLRTKIESRIVNLTEQVKTLQRNISDKPILL